MSWRALGIALQTERVELGDCDLWRERWQATGERVSLPHPTYPDQIYDFPVYTIEDARTRVRFAAAELSNGVWGFYVPS